MQPFELLKNPINFNFVSLAKMQFTEHTEKNKICRPIQNRERKKGAQIRCMCGYSNLKLLYKKNENKKI